MIFGSIHSCGLFSLVKGFTIATSFKNMSVLKNKKKNKKVLSNCEGLYFFEIIRPTIRLFTCSYPVIRVSGFISLLVTVFMYHVRNITLIDAGTLFSLSTRITWIIDSPRMYSW